MKKEKKFFYINDGKDALGTVTAVDFERYNFPTKENFDSDYIVALIEDALINQKNNIN